MEQAPQKNQEGNVKPAKTPPPLSLNAESDHKKTIEDAPAPGEECAP